MNQLLLLAERAETAVDYFWTGVWWIALRRWWYGRKLTEALVASGDRSMAARWAEGKYRSMQRGVTFWRASDPRVISVLERCGGAGIPPIDLKLLALNKDVRVVGDAVTVRRSWWSKVLAPLAVTVVLLNWARLSALVVLTPAPWPGKLVVLAVVTLLFWWFWRGFALYTTRSNAAVKRSGAAVEAVAMSMRREPEIICMADIRKT